MAQIMTAKEIRQAFLDFFEKKNHKIVPSAPIVNKDDPTLMFTNAGMNQFKDFFLGNQKPSYTRATDTQKCLRVSGKHNDLEEVGVDSYHHTMFEMLGNWSFGDYFKEEAIEWAWDLLTNVYGLDKDRLYVTIFEGDKSENLDKDNEATAFWEKWIAKDRILLGDKKDNFWEMGEQGPCGPCSEIHIDLRPDEERAKVDGATLVNMDDPLVVEVWNLVFIQYNRKADGSLEDLPAQHIDTGMGFERLCMALQGKQSNYATDVFTNSINFIEKASGQKYTYKYGPEAKVDTAIRVIADHIRAVAFTIADGQLPSNTGAGYVIRRILRRAIRYYYSVLNVSKPIMHELVHVLAEDFKAVFPELYEQKDFVSKVVLEEEKSFLRTLEEGLKRFDTLKVKDNTVAGADAFELYDTYGFPFDLTRLIASEQGYKIDEAGFEKALEAQKSRSRADAVKSVSDWTIVHADDAEVQFVGYDQLNTNGRIMRYRIVEGKKKTIQLVLDWTPFYAEGGGQVGDKGTIDCDGEIIHVVNTVRENDLIIHEVNKLPANLSSYVLASVNAEKRQLTENNHTATHLLHAALNEVLGTHVQQKGSLVNEQYLRFDFSHFSKVTEEEIAQIETIVNDKIRANIALKEDRSISIDEAKERGATMLFGEKYGDSVRMITFDDSYSKELCGGCHVDATGQIGLFKIKAESAVAAGVRRIEALTAAGAEAYVNAELNVLQGVKTLLKNPKNLVSSVESLQADNKALQKQIEQLVQAQAAGLKSSLIEQAQTVNGVTFIAQKVSIGDAKAIKNLAFEIQKEVDNVFLVLGAEVKGKPQLTVAVNKDLAAAKDLHAGKIVKALAAAIKGGGGGQPLFATAGGSDVSGLDTAIANAIDYIK